MRKLTTAEFVDKSKKAHGDRYDYSMVEYKNKRTKVSIICKIHGVFTQEANRHMQGGGCQSCGGNKKLTTEIFIERSKSLHGDAFDYSQSEYKGSHEKVIIICKHHGRFEQTAKSHLSGYGCKKCCEEKRKATTKEFIKKSIEIHGEIYDYTQVEYKHSHSKVKIICKKHGDFFKTPSHHLQGGGCSLCTREQVSKAKTKTKEQFVFDSKLIHGDKYCYSKSNYRGANEKVIIICDIHGEFEQAASCHTQGAGCNECSPRGYSAMRAGNLYVLRSECGKYVKIGISNVIYSRIAALKRSTPFEFNKIECFNANGGEIQKMESKFHKVFDNAGFKGFDGATEWFHYDSEKLEQLKNYGESINEN